MDRVSVLAWPDLNGRAQQRLHALVLGIFDSPVTAGGGGIQDGRRARQKGGTGHETANRRQTVRQCDHDIREFPAADAP